MKKLATLLIVLLFLGCTAVLADEVLINSKDWQDVYSGMQYGNIVGKQPRFLVSEKHSTIIMGEIREESHIEVYSSEKSPYVFGYESLLESNGYDADETISRSLSIELAKKLTDINSYIIIDDSYGYNAIAVAPYAIISKSYVLFADRNNIGEVLDFLESKTIDNVLIYGHVDREVRERLAKFNPEIINEDGDRFANNVEIVKRYKEISDAKQVLLTNGEFIESSLMSGAEPTLFIGTQNVPDKINEYIKSSNIEVGVLIGNELVGTATIVRRQAGISTFVKFARSARNPTGSISQVEGLDIFYLPKYALSLSIQSITYNSITRQLEVTLKNNVELASYFKGTYTIRSGNHQQTIGDLEPVFIDGNGLKTIVYDIEPIAGEDDITAKVFIVYGESKNSLEKTIDETVTVGRINVLDETAITIEKIVYNKGAKKFFVYIRNINEDSNESVFVDTEIIDFLVLDERQTFGAEDVIEISPGKTKASEIKVELEDEDFENNERVRVRAYYGQRENALVKIYEDEFELIVKTFNLMTYLPIAIIILLLILIIISRKKKKKND